MERYLRTTLDEKDILRALFEKEIKRLLREERPAPEIEKLEERLRELLKVRTLLDKFSNTV
jgi:predicted ArsR family transcriptional regulator